MGNNNEEMRKMLKEMSDYPHDVFDYGCASFGEAAALALKTIDAQQAEIERLCKKIGVMKESIEDAIMSETVFDTFDDLSSYVNAERCRSEEWTGGIRDAIQAVRAWGE